eukprot:CAMPEP_0202885030 /NCGR_PEP_ID=MMETSP1391-20130828/41455_1 /ASSEMBLY_ACC=CAM_ASM_000867 /TAXON_ID=1034604 /ORGANISM="Chlamydomonas leiostraca, Strain SAG 11-49" /LENGTH=79 /DNA_ID=CAMNT_0049568269 /DNA_START=1741 /DNA_END=1978 /DNA_ORIENTATION=+
MVALQVDEVCGWDALTAGCRAGVDCMGWAVLAAGGTAGVATATATIRLGAGTALIATGTVFVPKTVLVCNIASRAILLV